MCIKRPQENNRRTCNVCIGTRRVTSVFVGVKFLSISAFIYASLTVELGRMSINISLHVITAVSPVTPIITPTFSKTAKSNHQFRHDYLYVSNLRTFMIISR